MGEGVGEGKEGESKEGVMKECKGGVKGRSRVWVKEIGTEGKVKGRSKYG